VLTSFVFPEPGDAIPTVQANPAGVDPGPAGANQSWDFSGLTADDETQTTAVYLPAPPDPAFPDANLASFQYPVMLFLDTTFQYYRTTATDLIYYGWSTGSVHELYPDPQLLLKTPLSYNEMFNDAFTIQTNLPDNSTSGLGNRVVKYDAYGTLKLPTGAFNDAIRLFIEEQQRDTTWLFAGYAVNQLQETAYEWYVPGLPGPRLWIRTSGGTSTYFLPGQPPQIQELQETTVVGYVTATTNAPNRPDPAWGVALHGAGPNPAAETLRVRFDGASPSRPLHLLVFSADGRLLDRRDLQAADFGQGIDLPVAALPAGVYLLTLTDGNSAQSPRWQKL
jgi:hypothetical protein